MKEKKKILLIEEEHSLQEVLRMVLTGCGYEVIAHMDGNEAWDEFHSGPSRIDLVISDYQMSNTDGLDLCRQMKKIRPHLPVIIISGSVEEDLLKKVKSAGASAFIGKLDLKAHKLQILVEKLLAES